MKTLSLLYSSSDVQLNIVAMICMFVICLLWVIIWVLPSLPEIELRVLGPSLLTRFVRSSILFTFLAILSSLASKGNLTVFFLLTLTSVFGLSYLFFLERQTAWKSDTEKFFLILAAFAFYSFVCNLIY